MTVETIERENDYDVDDELYSTAIEKTADAVRERYDVKRIVGVRASCDNSSHQWWVTVTAEIDMDETERCGGGQ